MESSGPGAQIKLNVGGKLFETTSATLLAGGPDSLLASLAHPSADPIFIDRDPDLFSVLLSLLRTRRLPSSSSHLLPPHDLLAEAAYFGLVPLLRSAMSPPPLFGPDASLSATLLHPSTTALSAVPDGSVRIAHAGQISAYNFSLTANVTVPTHIHHITSLRHVSETIAAAGSTDSPGLHFYDVYTNSHAGSVHWADPADPRVYKATVSAIESRDPEPSGPLFAAFQCQHRENCILEVDRGEMRAASVIGRQSGGAAKTAVPGRLVHLAERGLLFASSVSRGAFGYSGYMRLWDPRSGAVAWEACEPGGSRRFGDSFSDADVDCSAEAIYKVCWKSGDLAVADIRRLGADPWVYLSEPRAALRRPVGGEDSVVHCYKGQVFVSRTDGLEVWTRLDGNVGHEGDDGRVIESGYRRDYVDTEEDAGRGLITRMEGGGDRLFLCREGLEGVEVWESSDLSGAVSLL